MHLKLIDTHEDRSQPLLSSKGAQQLLDIYDGFYAHVGFHFPWVGYYIVKNDAVVGSCGFTGAPQNGAVEIAYWTFTGHEGQGIASFACRQLVILARGHDPSLTITAKTAPETNASTHILEKNGFVFSHVVQDHEIGDAWFWVLKNQP